MQSPLYLAMRGSQIVAVEESPLAASAALQGKVKEIIVETIDAEPVANPAQAHARAAFQNARIPAMAESTVTGMSLREAHERVMPIFKLLSVRKQNGTYGVPSYVESAVGLADSLISSNMKLEKESTKPSSPYSSLENAEIKGLNLIPSNFLVTRFVDSYPNHPLTARIRELNLPARFTTCSGSSTACRSSCLLFTGQHAANSAYNDTIKAAKALALLEQPVAFLRLLLEGLQRSASRTKSHLYFRMNLLSDIPWELVCPWLFDLYPNIQFYDYTKVQGRDPGPRYDLTFSFSGNNEKASRKALHDKKRVALVLIGMVNQGRKGQAFRKLEKFPSQLRLWGKDALLVDGDVHDARPLDPPNQAWQGEVAVGLRWKIPIGSEDARKQLEASAEQGFVTPAYPLEDSGLQLRGLQQNPHHTLFAAPVTPRYSLQLEASELAG